jgi:hypothetical protein
MEANWLASFFFLVSFSRTRTLSRHVFLFWIRMVDSVLEARNADRLFNGEGEGLVACI